MKLAYILQDFPRLSETFILREIEEMQRRGHDLRVFALCNPGELRNHPSAQKLSTAVRYATSFTLAQKLGAFLHAARRRPATLARILGQVVCNIIRHPRWLGASCRVMLPALVVARDLEDVGITHVHAHFAYLPADLARIAAALTGATVTVSAHAWDIHAQPAAVLRRRLRGVSRIMACSTDGLQALEAKLGDGACLRLVHHGLPLDTFSPGSTKAAPPLVLAIGRFTAKKRFSDLVDACARLRGGDMPFRCVIAGDGPERQDVQRHIERQGLTERVQLVGALPQEEVLALLRDAAVFVHPAAETETGDREGIPNVLLEAMAMRVPVIATRTGGIPEPVHHDESGLLAAPRNPDQLAMHMKTLLSSEDERTRLGEAGYRHVHAHYDIVRNIDELVCVLEESVRGHGN